MNDRAAYERAKEEKEILEAEFKRQLQSYRRYIEVWGRIVEESATAGEKAYAARRKAFYAFLLASTEKKWYAAKAKAETVVKKAIQDGEAVRLLECFEKTKRNEHYESRLEAAAKEAEEYEKGQQEAAAARMAKAGGRV